MITKEEYEKARLEKQKLEDLMAQYHKEQRQLADERYKEFSSGKYYQDEDLFYSAYSFCPCGHGLAYVKGPGSQTFWDCSGILKGIADSSVEHTGRLPFAFYDVKGESAGSSTRGRFQPKLKVVE